MFALNSQTTLLPLLCLCKQYNDNVIVGINGSTIINTFANGLSRLKTPPIESFANKLHIWDLTMSTLDRLCGDMSLFGSNTLPNLQYKHM